MNEELVFSEQDWRDKSADLERRIAELEAELNTADGSNDKLRLENAALRKALEDAPHEPDCAAIDHAIGMKDPPCGCWKSKIQCP